MVAESGFVDLGVLPCTLDQGIAARAAIGLLVLATDQTMEHEFARLIRLPGVATYAARLFNDADITPETLRAMRDRSRQRRDERNQHQHREQSRAALARLHRPIPTRNS